MDKDRIEGSLKQAGGAVKETVGKLTGDAKTQAAGATEKCRGRRQGCAARGSGFEMSIAPFAQ
jgi:uncharacterized protein YjbJ (UPF0337 family)